MRKIFSSVAIGATLMLTLSGCMSVETNLVLNEDGKTGQMTMNTVVDLQKMAELQESMTGEKLTEEELSELSCDNISDGLEEEDKEMIEIKNDGMLCTVSMATDFIYNENGSIISEFNDTELDGFSQDNSMTLLKNDNNMVAFHAKSLGVDSSSSMFVESYTVSVTFPGGNIFEEAGEGTISDDGKTITWDLLKVKDDVIAEGSVKNSLPLATYLVIGIIGLAVVGGVIYMIVRSKGKNKSGNTRSVTADNSTPVIATGSAAGLTNSLNQTQLSNSNRNLSNDDIQDDNTSSSASSSSSDGGGDGGGGGGGGGE